MREFINLGDLRDPAMPETNPALIDCRDWESRAHGDVDRQVNACARSLSPAASREDSASLF